MNLFIFPHGLYFLQFLLVDVLFLLSEIVVAILFKVVLEALFGDSRFEVFNERVENVNLLFIEAFQVLLNGLLFASIELSHLFQSHDGEHFLFPDKPVRGIKPRVELLITFLGIPILGEPFFHFRKSPSELLQIPNEQYL